MPLALALALTCIASVHDGDTVRLCSGEKVRLAAIDAPELRGSPSCSRSKRASHWCDYSLGIESRDALRGLVAGRRVTIQRVGVDRYGRTLAHLSVNGRDAGDYLIARGLARAWPRGIVRR